MKKYILIITIILLQQCIFAQSYVSPTDSTSIDQQLDSHFGIDYEIYDMIFVDSLEVHYDGNRKLITDYYGTLDDCIVFTANIKGARINIKGVVGVYRNSQIIWYSDYIVPEETYSGGYINVIFDFNNDGLVEIMTEWGSFKGARYSSKSLFIHSWDGNQGTLSVELDEDGSPITCYEGKGYDYIDIQGDGVFEIINDTGIYGEEHPEVYEWNGTNYVKSAIELETTDMCFPRNNFIPIITAVVKKEGNAFRYNYKVENSVNSAQSINKFDVYGYVEKDNAVISTLAKNWRGHMLGGEFAWKGRKIDPGESITGLSYVTTGLPIIGKTFLRGFNYVGASCYDYKTNSVKGKTVVAKLPPLPFIATDFLNSLTTYTDSSYSLGWITNEQTKDKYNTYFNTAKTYLEQGDSSTARTELQKVLTDCNTDSSTVLTSEAYALLYFNTEYLVNKLPEGEPGLPVKLEDSQGNLLQGGSLQYYDAGWKDAIDNGDGTFTVQTEKSTVSLKMTYAGGSQQKDNVPVGADTAVFQTSDVTVKLLSSSNTLLDSGFVQYYAGGWQDFGTLVNGVAHKELLSKNYNFKMKYAGSEKNHVQNLDTNTTVTFHTVNAEVQLRDSQNNLLPGGTVEYYASGWKNFGEATNGKANKELLSRSYTFKMHYANAENNLVQDLDSSTTVVFHTVNTTVQLRDSQGNLLPGGFAKYYASGWQDFGEAVNGIATKELLPKQYTFKIVYAGSEKNHVQNLDTNTTVTFHTVNAEVQLRDSQGNLLSGGFAKYYASGWKDFGEAVNGIVHKELLSRAYTFKIQYGGADMNHVQNLDTNTTVVFNTINVKAELRDSQGSLLDGGTVEYYASGWKDFGEAANGTASKELLPREYTFKMNYGGLNTTKVQDVSTNNTVTFSTTLTTVKVKDNQNQPVENAEVFYYGSSWRQIGFTVNGEVTKELLARSINFKAKKDNKEKNKLQDTSADSVVEIILE